MKNTCLIRLFFIFFMSLSLSDLAWSQSRIPIIELQARYEYASIDGDDQWFQHHAFTPALLVALGNHFAAGAYYGKSFSGTHYSYPVGSEVKTPTSSTKYGFNLQVSTGRTRKWSGYFDINYFKWNLDNEDNPDADPSVSGKSESTSGFGIGAGVLYRISSGIYLNIVEVGMGFTSDQLELLEKKNMVQIKSGVKIQITQRK